MHIGEKSKKQCRLKCASNAAAMILQLWEQL